jgi:rsbT co-antagonist protein RsbR
MATDDDVAEMALFMASLYEDSPIPTSIYDREGNQVALNAAHGKMWNIRPEDVIGRFNMVTDPQLVERGCAECHGRVMQGETLMLSPHSFDSFEAGLQHARNIRRWAEATYFPLYAPSGDITHLCAILRDVTREVKQRQAEARAAGLPAPAEPSSRPVVYSCQGIVTMPLIGELSSRRSAKITYNLLGAVSRRRAHCVLLDVTGVPSVDKRAAHHLIETAEACGFLGCAVSLVGIGARIAHRLGQLGVDLSRLGALADIQAGIDWAFQQRGPHALQSSGF